ncbi:hypothetical protein BDR04DRAFT_1116039 [Suillus decipiens]|nr:hypothetical protein BDR04DRAFT_1116039 [Suillus decipiens]
MTISTNRPSGRIKADIHLVITKHTLEHNPVYGAQYAVAGNQPKFGHTVTNCLTYVFTKKILVSGGKQITAQVASEFPWFEDFDALWKDNPAFSPKTFSSAPGKDCAGGLQALTQPTHTHVLDNYNLDDMNTYLDNMNPDLDDSPNKGTPAAAIEDYDPAYDNYDPMHDDHDPSLKDCDYMMGHGGWDSSTEEMEMEEDNYGEQDDIQQHLSKKCPHQTFPSLPHTFKPTNHTTYAPSSSAHTFSSSSYLDSKDSPPLHRPGQLKPAHKCSLSGHVRSGTSDVLDQVGSLTDDMSYIYSAKAAASEYKIVKVNVLRHECNIQFQHEQATIECTEAASVHERSQEAKVLELRLLKAQAKVQSKKAAALCLEIELINLKEGSSAKWSVLST